MRKRTEAKSKMEKNYKRASYINLLIFSVLILTILILLYTMFFSRDNKNKGEIFEFVKNINEVQEKLSYYLGKTSTEMFDIYTVEQIVTGVNDIQKPNESGIKDNNNETITSLVSTSVNSIEKQNSITGYLVIQDNIKKVLNVDLNDYIEVRYYIQDNGTIKVKFDTVPDWWDESLDSYKLGAK